MRKLEFFVGRYGADAGSRLFHVLQSQSGHASVGARLRRKLEAIRERGERLLPLFERPIGCENGSIPVNLAADPLGLPPVL